MNRIFAVLLLVILCSCRTKKPQPVRTKIFIPREVAGTDIPVDDIDSVRFGERVKCYTIGRYIDPNNPDIMVEAHPVYKVEEQSVWNLEPNAPYRPPINTGPNEKYARASSRLFKNQLDQQILRQNKLTAQLEKHQRNAVDGIDKINKVMVQNKYLLQQNKNLTMTVNQLQKELENLVRELDEMKETLSCNNKENKKGKGTTDEKDLFGKSFNEVNKD